MLTARLRDKMQGVVAAHRPLECWQFEDTGRCIAWSDARKVSARL